MNEIDLSGLIAKTNWEFPSISEDSTNYGLKYCTSRFQFYRQYIYFVFIALYTTSITNTILTLY